MLWKRKKHKDQTQQKVNQRKQEILKEYESLKFGDKIGENKYFITTKIQGSESIAFSFYNSLTNEVEYMSWNEAWLLKIIENE